MTLAIVYRLVIYVWGLLGIIIDMNFRYHLYLKSKEAGGQAVADGDTLWKFDQYLNGHTLDLFTAWCVYTAFYGIWLAGLLPGLINLAAPLFGKVPQFATVVGWFSGPPNFATIAWGLGALEIFEWCERIWTDKLFKAVSGLMKK